MPKKYTCCDSPRIVKSKSTGKRKCKNCGTDAKKSKPKFKKRQTVEPKDDAIGIPKKKRSGYKDFSPWYDEQFLAEKIEEKKASLAILEANGDIRSKEGWNEKAKRSFQRNFDRLGVETKRAYQSSARQFGKYLGLRKMHSEVSNIVARLIVLSYIEATTLVDEYIMWMEESELAPGTINVRLAALRWFVDAARRVGWVDWKLDIRNVKGGKVRDTKGPSDAEFRRILRVVNTMGGPKGARTKALVYILGFMGVRISSAISLDMENISVESKSVRVKWKGKGDTKAHYVWRPIGEETFEALNDWLEVRGRHGGAVFVSMDRAKKGTGRLSVRSAQRDIENVGREAATIRKLTPHGFRHFFSTNNLEHEGDTRRVMKATGHTNIKTIEAYDDSDDRAAREVIESMESRWIGALDDTEDDDEAEIQERYGDSSGDEDMGDSELEGLGIVSATSAAKNFVSYNRISTGMKSVDKLFGGKGKRWGLVRGSLVLLGGFPGIGKSTLARQICYNICQSNPGMRVLYGSAEETAEQISEALVRLECSHDNFLLMPNRSVNAICRASDKVGASVVVIDSVSTAIVDGVDKRPGSITQVKACGQVMLDWCKGVDGQVGSDAVVILIAHVDKKGDIAGPKELEHHVDAVFSFMSPSKRSKHRSLGCEGKNRFGDATGEIFFEMTGKGLIEAKVDDDEDDYSVFDDDYEENAETESLDDLEKRVSKSVKKSKAKADLEDDLDDDDLDDDDLDDDSDYGDFSGDDEGAES